MREEAKTLLGIGLAIGLSDREKFISQVSDVINHYQTDPQRGDQWAHGIVAYLEQMKKSMTLENAIYGAMKREGTPDKESISELTKAIKELTTEMQKKQNS